MAPVAKSGILSGIFSPASLAWCFGRLDASFKFGDRTGHWNFEGGWPNHLRPSLPISRGKCVHTEGGWLPTNLLQT